jgi:hypothetical protein
MQELGERNGVEQERLESNQAEPRTLRHQPYPETSN